MRGRGHIIYIVKMLGKTKYIVMNKINKEGFTNIVKIMTPMVGVIVLDCRHISDIVKMITLKLSILIHGINE